MTKTKIAIAAYLTLLASTMLVNDSAPTWIRLTLVVAILAPVAAAVVLWPVLLVRGLGDVLTPDASPAQQETRIQVLDGGDQR